MNAATGFLTNRCPVTFDPEAPAQLIVVVDTEEEFDWLAPPDRSQTGVSAMRHIDRAQSICDEFGIRPCYVADYPVVTQAEGYEPLQAILRRGGCEIGAHLHPWVNPPFEEELTVYNSYPGNLPVNLEAAKLRQLKEAIDQTFGITARCYKAGRYGFGSNTARVLENLGFDIDLSFCPPVDHSADGGPDYSAEGAAPCFFGSRSQLLEIPLTGAFAGRAGRAARPLFNLSRRLEWLRLPGIFARLNLVDRLVLSPEGYQPDEHIKLTRYLHNHGQRVFTWSFHSPSVVPGFTEYVRTERDAERFLDSFRRFFDFFLNDLGGVATTPTTLFEQLEHRS